MNQPNARARIDALSYAFDPNDRETVAEMLEALAVEIRANGVRGGTLERHYGDDQLVTLSIHVEW